MEALKEIWENCKEWLTDKEINDFFKENSNIVKCINECESPAKSDIFNAFKGLTPQKVKVLIIGQDPYPEDGRADGMAFSFGNEEPARDSLKNIFSRIEELGIKNLNTSLKEWRRQGVLLLNTSLTLKKDKKDSIQKKLRKEHLDSWTPFINCIIKQLINKKNNEPLVIMLFGERANLIDEFKNDKDDDYKLENKNVYIIRTSHPSNLGCAKNYCGNYSNKLKHGVKAFMCGCNNPFKKCNDFLKQKDLVEINWSTD